MKKLAAVCAYFLAFSSLAADQVSVAVENVEATEVLKPVEIMEAVELSETADVKQPIEALEVKTKAVCHKKQSMTVREILHQIIDAFPILDRLEVSDNEVLLVDEVLSDDIDEENDVDPRDLIDQVFDAVAILNESGIEVEMLTLYEKLIAGLRLQGVPVNRGLELGFKMLIEAKAAGLPYPSDETITEAIIAAGYHLEGDE